MTDGYGNKIYLPPRKKFKPERCLIIRFIIPGLIPGKKNRQRADINRNKIKGILNRYTVVNKALRDELDAVKPFIRPSPEYEEFELRIKENITLQAERWHKSYAKYNLSYPIKYCSISIYHYWKDLYTRDNTNREDTIHDLLRDLGIITDDSSKVLRKNEAEADFYVGEMLDHATVVTIAAYDW